MFYKKPQKWIFFIASEVCYTNLDHLQCLGKNSGGEKELQCLLRSSEYFREH